MTNNELLDLLREARECVICPFANRQTMYCACTFCALKNRIGAALSESSDSATDVVEWDEGENYEGKHWWDTMIGDRAVHVEAWDKGGTRFYWRVFSTLDEEGHQPTLDKAKSAAIAAAKGMR